MTLHRVDEFKNGTIETTDNIPTTRTDFEQNTVLSGNRLNKPASLDIIAEKVNRVTKNTSNGVGSRQNRRDDLPLRPTIPDGVSDPVNQPQET